MKRSLVGIVAVMVFVTGQSPSYACPSDQYEQCVFGACVCLPKIGGAVGETTEQWKKESRAQSVGLVLEAWLIGSRSTSVHGAQPMPPQIRQALSGYIGDDVMNRARFKIGDKGVLNLAGLSIAYGDRFTGDTVSAVTLIDVIVFADANDAYNNPALWAHELTHVKQFMDWGTRNFAISYARDVGSVENPAYAAGDGFAGPVARNAPSRMPGGPIPVPQPAGLPPGFGMLVCGCYGFNPSLTAHEPRCQSQSVRLNACPGFCPGGGSPYAYVCQ